MNIGHTGTLWLENLRGSSLASEDAILKALHIQIFVKTWPVQLNSHSLLYFLTYEPISAPDGQYFVFF